MATLKNNPWSFGLFFLLPEIKFEFDGWMFWCNGSSVHNKHTNQSDQSRTLVKIELSLSLSLNWVWVKISTNKYRLRGMSKASVKDDKSPVSDALETTDC